MRKLKTLLVLSGLAVCVLTGCKTQSNTSKSSTAPDSTTTSSEVVKTLESIRIAAEPTKKNYYVGDQFDAAGLAVKAVYNTGEEDVAADKYVLSGFDSATPGEKTVTVTYEGKTATFKVNVIAVVAESIAITSEPTKKDYFVGDQFDPAGLAVKATFNNGSEATLAANDYQLSGFDSTTAGEKTITVTYAGKTATFKVNVQAIVLARIEVVAEPTKTTYYQDEEFDAAGLQVKAVMNNGSEEVLAADAYALTGFDSSKGGVNTVTVTYQEKTATFNLTIIGKDGIEITAPTKVRYGVGDEFDATGLVVKQKYADGTKKELTADQYSVTGFDSSSTGEKTVVIVVGTQTAEFKVNVYKADWTAEEKASMAEELLYEIPFFPSFELDVNGIANEEDPTKLDVAWYEAKSEFVATEDDLIAYADQIASEMVGEKEAWTPYALVGIQASYTLDVEKLGFDTTKLIFQFSRQKDDLRDSDEFQMLSIGFDADGKLLVAATICDFPDRAYDWEGKGYYVNNTASDGSDLNIVEDIYYEIINDRAAKMFSARGTATDDFEYPQPTSSTDNCAYFVDAINEPYFLANKYSKQYDTASCTLEFNKGKGAGSFTQADLDTVLAKYTANGKEIVTDSTTYSFTTYSVNLDTNGYDITLTYFVIQGDIVMEVEFNGYTAPVVPGTMGPKDIADHICSYFTGAEPEEDEDNPGNWVVVLGLGYTIEQTKTLVSKYFAPAEFSLVVPWHDDQFDDGTAVEWCRYKNSLGTCVEFIIRPYTFSNGEGTLMQAYCYTAE